jgi:hypothetical protein
MLTKGRNRNAEMAFEMATKLVTKEQFADKDYLNELWEKCHSDKDVLDAVNLYLASSSSYAPKAKAKLITELERLVA